MLVHKPLGVGRAQELLLLMGLGLPFFFRCQQSRVRVSIPFQDPISTSR